MAKTRRGNHSKEVLTSNDYNQQKVKSADEAVLEFGCEKLQERVRTKKVTWSDENIQNMSVGEIDRAIICVQERVMIKYSKEDLLEIGKSPLSKAKPDFLDPNEVCVSILDPDKWNLERKKSDTPDTGSKSNENGETRRRSGDPRERIRKENDGIVLSPQRRSFNSGCFVPANKEPLGGKTEPPSHLIGVRDIPSTTRRIGSGRIMRDWPENEKDLSEPDFNFTRGASHSRNNEREDKFGDRGMREENKFGERRSFGRGEMDNSKDKEGRRNTRYSESRRRYADKEDEPEWFSSGPISQNDTIELRGFDESEKLGKKKQPSRLKRAKEWSKKKESTIVEDKEKIDPKERSTPNHIETTSKELKENGEEPKRQPTSQPSQKHADSKQQSSQADHSFDFDEFLKGENIPELLTNGEVNETDKTTSRFSRWFKKESPNKELGGEASRKSSIQEDNHIIKDLLKDINESSSIPMSVRTPMDSNIYFTPISPAGNSRGALENMIGDKSRSAGNVGQSINIMDILARSRQQSQQPEGWSNKNQAPSMGSGKILSLDELESKIRPNSEHSVNVQQKQPPQKPDEEMTANFKRLLQQAGAHPGSQNGPMNKPPPMSLLEMLSHSQQQDEARMAAAQAAAANHHLLSAFHSHQPQVHNDLALKLQQAQLQQKQMEMLVSGKLMSAGTAPTAAHMRASPLLEISAQQSRELLSRPEAQAILQAIHQRIPSPRELQLHTQNILHRALIKKKLEEQTENFRKKQELQRGASPNSRNIQSGKGVSSPTPLAFTPTSVLRKMTADKDEGKENKAVTDNVKPQGRAVTGMRQQPQVTVNNQQWNQAFPMKQAGRPIVKANNYQSQTPDQFFAQLAAQQQPLPQQRTYQAVSNAAHRKPIIGQQYSVQGSQYGQSQPQYSHPNNPQTFQQPTAQQLRAQHQHRPSNPVTQQPANVQGQQNQTSQNQPNSQSATSQKQHGNPQPIGYPAAQQGTAAWQQFLNSTAQPQNTRPSTTSTGLSPSTTDQLTRWFSPDLLERARGGELPSTANLARLEEIERQAAPTVHN
uniref:Eukaryotic translation initiation factor 4E transporter-like n=1 Tax=Dendroctonus ponderosae TaxID=77166 RepID=A0AAR5Q152_DENPD